MELEGWRLEMVSPVWCDAKCGTRGDHGLEFKSLGKVYTVG